MRIIFGLCMLLGSLPAWGQQGIVTNYVRLQPTTLPTHCNEGDLRTNTSTGYLSSCYAANTWADIVTAGLVMTTLGDILYENSTPTPTRLAGNTTTTKEYLSPTGTGSVSAAPAWSQITFADISGLTTKGDILTYSAPPPLGSRWGQILTHSLPILARLRGLIGPLFFQTP